MTRSPVLIEVSPCKAWHSIPRWDWVLAPAVALPLAIASSFVARRVFDLFPQSTELLVLLLRSGWIWTPAIGAALLVPWLSACAAFVRIVVTPIMRRLLLPGELRRFRMRWPSASRRADRLGYLAHRAHIRALWKDNRSIDTGFWFRRVERRPLAPAVISFTRDTWDWTSGFTWNSIIACPPALPAGETAELERLGLRESLRLPTLAEGVVGVLLLGLSVGVWTMMWPPSTGNWALHGLRSTPQLAALLWLAVWLCLRWLRAAGLRPFDIREVLVGQGRLTLVDIFGTRKFDRSDSVLVFERDWGLFAWIELIGQDGRRQRLILNRLQTGRLLETWTASPARGRTQTAG